MPIRTTSAIHKALNRNSSAWKRHETFFHPSGEPKLAWCYTRDKGFGNSIVGVCSDELGHLYTRVFGPDFENELDGVYGWRPISDEEMLNLTPGNKYTWLIVPTSVRKRVLEYYTNLNLIDNAVQPELEFDQTKLKL